jgi:hypothetical protein
MTRLLTCLPVLGLFLLAQGDAVAARKPLAPTKSKVALESARTLAERLRKVQALTPTQRASRFRELSGLRMPATAFRRAKTLHARDPYVNEGLYFQTQVGAMLDPKHDLITVNPANLSLLLYSRIPANRHLFVDCVVEIGASNKFDVYVYPSDQITITEHGYAEFPEATTKMTITGVDDRVSLVVPKASAEQRVTVVIVGSGAHLRLQRCEVSEVY